MVRVLGWVRVFGMVCLVVVRELSRDGSDVCRHGSDACVWSGTRRMEVGGGGAGGPGAEGARNLFLC